MHNRVKVNPGYYPMGCFNNKMESKILTVNLCIAKSNCIGHKTKLLSVISDMWILRLLRVLRTKEKKDKFNSLDDEDGEEETTDESHPKLWDLAFRS